MKTTLISHLIKIEDKEVLARVWCDFNRWNWPQDLPDKFKPFWWDGHVNLEYKDVMNRKQGFDAVVMPFVESRTTKDLIDKWWMMPKEENV